MYITAQGPIPEMTYTVLSGTLNSSVRYLKILHAAIYCYSVVDTILAVACVLQYNYSFTLEKGAARRN